MKTRTYKKTVWTFVFNEDTREPLWVVNDLVINPNNLKIEAFIIKDSFFKDPKILESKSSKRWGKDIFISYNSIKTINDTENIKKILLKEIWIIWNKVLNESWVYIWHVRDLVFNWDNLQWISLVVQKSFFWLFFYWKELLIWTKSVINIKKDWIIIKNINLIKDTA